MVSEEDKQRFRARFGKQLRHILPREEELRRQQAAKAQNQQKQARGPRRGGGWDEDDEGETFVRMRPRADHEPQSAPHSAADTLPRGTVTAVHQGRIEVDFAPARVAPRLLLDPAFRLVVGDEVAFEATDGPPRVVAILPRRTVLARPDPGNPHRELLLAANVDLAGIVVAVVDPPLRPGLIDRFLLALQRGGVAPVVCANKVDRLDEAGRGELAALTAVYAALGVPVVACSARLGIGLDELRERLRGRTCVLVGHSGVGKSSLANALDPAGARDVGAVSVHGGRGRHTTSAAQLRELPGGTRLIDTPGVRAFGLQPPSPQELAEAFPEFAPFAAACRFADCSHSHEPDCAVRAAVEAGKVAAARFGSYLRIRAGDGEAD